MCILIFMEICREIFEIERYYQLATLFINEFILIVSILTHFHSSMVYMPYQNSPFEMNFLDFAIILICCLCWLQNTIVHILLCRWEILTVSKFEEKFQCWIIIIDIFAKKREKKYFMYYVITINIEDGLNRFISIYR